MTSASFLKIISVIGSIAGTVAATNSIPGMSPGAGSTVIGISALVWKITDMIEANAVKNAANQISPVSPPPTLSKT